MKPNIAYNYNNDNTFLLTFLGPTKLSNMFIFLKIHQV